MLGFQKRDRIHFVGIGGIGMSGIAEILLDQGYSISGSDLTSGPVTDRLTAKGATVYFAHEASNVQGASLVVYSSAIDMTNSEMQAAKENKIPLVRRAEMLAELMRLKYGIAVAGSHGKTTTTSMTATIFAEAKLDPTHVIGGVVHNLGNHAHQGEGQYLIAEADESDGSFLTLNPIMAVITNIDNDHLDYYKSESNLLQAFEDFANKVPFYGRAILHAHDKNTPHVVERMKRPYIKFGIAQGIADRLELDYAADRVRYSPGLTEFDLYHKGEKTGAVKIHVSGVHNVLNALAAIAVSRETGLSFEQIVDGISKFRGVGRRLESLWKKDKFEIVDDYGHHPTEVKATLATLKNIYKRPICVVFEPHRYTRTKQLWNDFKESFNDADEVFIGPVYAASEAAIPGISGDRLAMEMQASRPNVQYLSSLDGMKELVKERLGKDVIFLTMGAGNISKKIKSIIGHL